MIVSTFSHFAIPFQTVVLNIFHFQLSITYRIFGNEISKTNTMLYLIPTL